MLVRMRSGGSGAGQRRGGRRGRALTLVAGKTNQNESNAGRTNQNESNAGRSIYDECAGNDIYRTNGPYW